MSMASKRNLIHRLMNAAQHTACPCHGCRAAASHGGVVNQLRKLATPVDLVQKEYAFEVCLPYPSHEDESEILINVL